MEKAHLFFCLRTAFENGEDRHPQKVMKELAYKLNFKILGALPQTAGDGWDFFVEYITMPKFPKYLLKNDWPKWEIPFSFER